jgi:hypothetical protein
MFPLSAVRVGQAVKTLTRCGVAAITVTTMAIILTMTSVAVAQTSNSKAVKNKTIVMAPSGFAVSQRAADLPIDQSLFEGKEIHEPGPGPLRSKAGIGPWQQEDSVLQKEAKPLVSATPGVDFDGIVSPGFVPSDSNLAVGPNDIVEVVNVQFAVYQKNGTLLAGPTDIQTLFTPLGGVCASTFGDPVALYDRAADRWVISFIGSNAAGSIGAECVAVSQTNDPTGAYFLYGYSFGTNLNDYPKLSTWATASNSAYLATYNIFANFENFTGSELCAFDRTKMLAGNSSAAQLCQTTPSDEFGYLPSDMDGPTPPVDGTPGLFITWQNNNPGQLFLRKLTLNFATAKATLSAATTISVANSTLACSGGGQCVPQLGTTQTLDSLGDRMMYRFAIRHFADHDRAVVNHSVANGSQVGVRWYELYDPAGTVTLNQQGTFAPDSTYRWMASLAEDQNGDIGLGYSASSGTIHPAIRFTGRVPTDALGTMETETTIVQGNGSQTASPNAGNRWGDYTAMQVDPSDDCTFWYVDQYESVSGVFNWNTNIASFAFDSCSATPTFFLTASPGTVSVAEGSAATSTVTETPVSGFSGNVTLSATGLPSGVTAAFSPNPTNTTSTLTLTASATAAMGTSTVTIKGKSGSLSSTTTLSLTVTGSGSGPTVTLTPATLAWGKVVLGATGPTKTATLANTGTSTLNISGIATSGDFALASSTKPCGSTLAAGKSCLVKVTFSPTQLGARTGTLTITDNSPSSPQTVALSGTGLAQATLTPVSKTFPTEKVGVSSPAVKFTLANKQAVALTSIVISTTGKFSVSATTCTTTLAAKSTCTISVVFTPTATGATTGTLQVADSAAGTPQISNLTGTGK